MELNSELFAPLFRDLMHLEITLVEHPFTNRTSAPDPEDQLRDIMQSYWSTMFQSVQNTESVMDELELAAFENEDSMELFAASVASAPDESVDLSMSFGLIEEIADSAVKDLQNRSNDVDFEEMMAEAGTISDAVGEEEAETVALNLQAKLDEQEQLMLRIQDNSRHINRILREANYQPPAPSQDSRPADEIEVIGMAADESGDEQPTGEDLPANGTQGPVEERDENANKPQWTPEQVTQIRKYWELRPDDKVLMRTVISMDGDVITHIDPSITREEFDHLHTLHKNSVDVSVNFWKGLIGILTEFVNIVVDTLSARF